MSSIDDVIQQRHFNDEEQLEIIFSNESRLVVNAPAGYGKTKTLESKIAYLIAKDTILYPKKILALTFSVNAAYKIKIDISRQLPELFKNELNSPISVKDRVLATNYHGLCRRILKLYGYLISENLKHVDTLKAIDDKAASLILEKEVDLDSIDISEINTLANLDSAVKAADRYKVKEYNDRYLYLVKKYLLPRGEITFNSIILFSAMLFDKYPAILSFYRLTFPYIIVDEFQDTNILGFMLLQSLIGENTKVILFGDPLQRIYGFIGAIPNIMSRAQQEYKMKSTELKHNYRFKNNKQLLLLDKNIRENAKDISNPIIKENAIVNLTETNTQEEEAESISTLIKKIKSANPSAKIALLVKQRGRNIDKIMETLEAKDIEYFYALYSDDDLEYIKFHNSALELFYKSIGNSDRRVTKKICEDFVNQLETQERESISKSIIYKSLFQLLNIFISKIFEEFKLLSTEDKIILITNVLENRSLKQYLISIDFTVTVSTVHGSKGLEWDYVILPDMEQYSFPNFLGLCSPCKYQNGCAMDWGKINQDVLFETKFYEELSVFYVAATREKNDIYFTSSKFGYSNYTKPGLPSDNLEKKRNRSCLLALPGITVNFTSV